jgi:hypothetical protein
MSMIEGFGVSRCLTSPRSDPDPVGVGTSVTEWLERDKRNMVCRCVRFGVN